MGAQWVTTGQTNEGEMRKPSVISFDGGHNSSTPPALLGPNQSSSEYGWSFDKYPALSPTTDYVLISNPIVTKPHYMLADLGSQVIRQVGGSFMWANDSNLDSWTTVGGSLAEIKADFTKFEVGGKKAVVFTNGTDPVKYWDGTTLANLLNAPKGKFITSDTVRLWIADGSILKFCGFLNPTDWSSARNSGSVEYYTPDGGDITGLTQYDGRTVVFKENSMGEIHGTNYFEFQLISISGEIGCCSNRSIQQIKGSLFWMDRNDVWVSQGYPKSIGEPIRKYLKSVDWTRVDHISSATDGLRYYLSLPIVGDPDGECRLFSYDPTLNQWRVDYYGAKRALSLLHNGVWYMGDRGGGLYKRSGVHPQSSYTTGMLSEGSPQAYKEYMEIHIQVMLPIGSRLTVSAIPDGGSSVMIDTILSSVDSPQSLDHIIPLDAVPLCKWIQFHFSLVGPGELYSAVVYYNLLPVQH